MHYPLYALCGLCNYTPSHHMLLTAMGVLSDGVLFEQVPLFKHGDEKQSMMRRSCNMSSQYVVLSCFSFSVGVVGSLASATTSPSYLLGSLRHPIRACSDTSSFQALCPRMFRRSGKATSGSTESAARSASLQIPLSTRTDMIPRCLDMNPDSVRTKHDTRSERILTFRRKERNGGLLTRHGSAIATHSSIFS